MKHKRRTHKNRTRVLRRLKIRKHLQLYLRQIACDSRRLFQPKKESALAGEGGQSSSVLQKAAKDGKRDKRDNTSFSPREKSKTYK